MEKDVQIISYKKEYAPDFKQLNTAWLQKYFYVEPIDEVVLGDPEEAIIKKGGHIYFACRGNEIVGTFALIPEAEGVYELSKMAVREDWQGKRIGNQLLQHSLEQAKALGAVKVILYSNTKLEPAIHLYRKYGFREVTMGSSEYKRSNIKMEIVINTK